MYGTAYIYKKKNMTLEITHMQRATVDLLLYAQYDFLYCTICAHSSRR